MTYKIVEIVGVSEESIEDAIGNAYQKAGSTLDHLRWFEVGEIRGNFEKNKPTYQVTVKMGFRLNE